MIKGLDEKFVKAYLDFMVDNAVIFGANQTKAEGELKDALEFEIKLANVNSNKCSYIERLARA